MISSRSEQTHEVRERSLPDTELKLVHQIRREHLIAIKIWVPARDSCREGVLRISRSVPGQYVFSSNVPG